MKEIGLAPYVWRFSQLGLGAATLNKVFHVQLARVAGKRGRRLTLNRGAAREKLANITRPRNQETTNRYNERTRFCTSGHSVLIIMNRYRRLFWAAEL